MSAQITALSLDGRVLNVSWENTSSRFHTIWLRDNCLCGDCRHPTTNQRLREIASLTPEAVDARSATYTDGKVTIQWADAHTSTFDIDWLSEHIYDRAQPNTIELWRGDFEVPTFEPSDLADLLKTLLRTGLVRVRNVPTERGEVARFAQRIGMLRTTNYGATFDVESVPDATHLAYTGVALALHTDNPYRDPLPGYQLLHCLESSTSGGDSVFVDAFAAAIDLRQSVPAAFDVLASTPVTFRYRDADCDLVDRAPMLRVEAGELRAVRYNDRSMAPLDVPFDRVEPFYAAYRAFNEIVEEQARAACFHLEAGELVIFDNERILHGRTAFTGEGGRRLLQGCYVDRDGVLSTLRRAIRPELASGPGSLPRSRLGARVLSTRPDND